MPVATQVKRQTRNDVIDEVIAAIKGVKDHETPMPEELREPFNQSLQDLGLETLCRLSAEALKGIVLDTVAQLKN